MTRLGVLQAARGRPQPDDDRGARRERGHEPLRLVPGMPHDRRGAAVRPRVRGPWRVPAAARPRHDPGESEQRPALTEARGGDPMKRIAATVLVLAAASLARAATPAQKCESAAVSALAACFGKVGERVRLCYLKDGAACPG